MGVYGADRLTGGIRGPSTLTTLAVGDSGAFVAGLVLIAIPAESAPNGGGTGDPLLRLRVNQAGPMTVLKTNGGFRILAKALKRPPLMVFTPDSTPPPLQVSSQAKADNLKADLLDGFDASAFVRGSELVAAPTEANGSEYVVAGVETVVASVSLTPPSPGTVLVWSSGTAEASVEGEGVDCSITTGTAVDDDAWQGGGALRTPMPGPLPEPGDSRCPAGHRSRRISSAPTTGAHRPSEPCMERR